MRLLWTVDCPRFINVHDVNWGFRGGPIGVFHPWKLKEISSRELTVRPWKLMVGRCNFSFGKVTFQGLCGYGGLWWMNLGFTLDWLIKPYDRWIEVWFSCGFCWVGGWRVKLHSLPKEPGSQLWCANEEADFCCSLVDLFIFVHLSQQESPGYHFSTWPCNEPSQKWDPGWLTVGFLGWPLIWQERPSGSNGHICRQSESSASLGQCYRWW